MSATKASNILSISPTGATVSSAIDGWQHRHVPWHAMPKGDLVRCWGITRRHDPSTGFPSGTPIHHSLVMLRENLEGYWHGRSELVVCTHATTSAAAEEAMRDAMAAAAAIGKSLPDNPFDSVGGIRHGAIPVTPVTPDPIDPDDVAAAVADDVATAEAALAEAVRVVAAAARATDEERVREIVGEMVGAMAPTVHTTTIVVPNRPTPAVMAGVVHPSFLDLVTTLSAGFPAFLYGPPATGKTHAAIAACEALGVRVGGLVGCSPDIMPSSLKGFVSATGGYVSSAFRDTYENGGIFIVDEIDNAPMAVTIGILNTVLSTAFLTFPDRIDPVFKHESFGLVACANTFGTGSTASFDRFAVDPSTMDRFVRLEFAYDETVDLAILRSVGGRESDVGLVMDAIVKMRGNIETHGLRSFVTNRGGKAAVTLLGMGWSWETVLDRCLMPAGTTSDQRRQILSGVQS